MGRWWALVVAVVVGGSLELAPVGMPSAPARLGQMTGRPVWLSIPRLDFRHHVLLRTLPRGVLLATVRSAWLWTMQSPHPHEKPRPFPGDEVDFERARLDFRPVARFYTQRVLTLGIHDQRRWPPGALLVRHCGLIHSSDQCTVVIAQTAERGAR